MDQLEKLLARVQDHGHSACASLLDNVLHCRYEYTYKDEQGNIHAGSDWETVKPTVKDVKEWLGY